MDRFHDNEHSNSKTTSAQQKGTERTRKHSRYYLLRSLLTFKLPILPSNTLRNFGLANIMIFPAQYYTTYSKFINKNDKRWKILDDLFFIRLKIDWKWELKRMFDIFSHQFKTAVCSFFSPDIFSIRNSYKQSHKTAETDKSLLAVNHLKPLLDVW